MATITLYVSGQTEIGDVTEFFQKHMVEPGENVLAFFDGVFYESHQERVGNIAFQDYLIYSDKSVYLWARGASKDYLDRFDLSTVSLNSRNKDGDFATLNLKVRRDGKDPVYVIFDMVERREAELIVKLHTIMESMIESQLGASYRGAIPDALAADLHNAALDACPSRQLNIALDPPADGGQESAIGYGQDLLEQYKASIGYQAPEGAPGTPPGMPGQGAPFNPADAMKGFENMLPADPESLKGVLSSIKGLIGDAPFKLREQVKKDLQHVPGDMAAVLTAMNELVSNIAGNPQAEQFVMTAIKTAVRNDGVLGTLSNVVKMTSSGMGGAKKGATAAGSRQSVVNNGDDTSTIRRKKITIKDDVSGAEEATTPVSSADAPPAPRKKVKIQADDSEMSELVKDMMEMDKPQESPQPAPQRKKIQVKDEGAEPTAKIPEDRPDPAS